MVPEPVTTSVWLEQQLQRTLGRIDALAHEVDLLRESLRAEQAETVRLQEEIALLGGRTGRHEAGLDQVGGLRQQLAALEQRLEAEAAFRRDRAGQLSRDQQRDAGERQSLEEALDRLTSELARVGDRLAAVEERQRQVAGDLAATARDDTAVDVRLDTLERQVQSLAADVRSEADRRAGDASVLPDLRLALDAVEARTLTLQQEQQRLEDELAHLDSPAGLESLAGDAVEQVRSLRERAETRLSALERHADEAGRSHTDLAQEHALLDRRVAGLEEQLRQLGGRLDAQRETLVAHVRRATAAEEEADRRTLQEIDRRTRARRQLLTRLTEDSDEGAQEQPL
jgi:chromosome segregation ATPase